jgi:hypothetical protein
VKPRYENTVTKAEVQSWDRLARETDTQWAYFLVFRDWAYPGGAAQPSSSFRPRNLREIARELGVVYSALANASAACHWYARAAAYDREIDQRRTKAGLSRVSKVRERTEKALDELGLILELERVKLLSRASDPAVPALTVRELGALQELVLKHEQLLSSAPDLSKTKDVEFDLETWDEEDLEAQDRLLAKQEAKGLGQPGSGTGAPSAH